MSQINWDEYKDEILRLKKEGLGSRKISNHFAQIGVTLPDNHIRQAIRRWKNSDPDLFEEVLDDAGFIDPTNWSRGWLKTEEASIFIENNRDLFLQTEDIIEAITESLDDYTPLPPAKPLKPLRQALRAVISDCHVGMDSNTEDAMFGFEYNEKVFNKHLDSVFDSLRGAVENFGEFETIFVDDLGDGLDGYNAETTRGGHKLPQNMSNKESFRVYVAGKINTYRKIIESGWATRYIFRNVTNCNHSGDFGWTANYAVQQVLLMMYPNVEYILLEKPIEHFVYGKHCFLITHGKDKRLMKKNWPLHVNPAVENLIRDYIDHHDIKQPYIHLDKGDLHQTSYDRRPIVTGKHAKANSFSSASYPYRV